MQERITIPVDIIYTPDYDLETWGPLEPATDGSAGYDVRSCSKETLFIGKGETTLINLGIKIYIKDPNYCALLLPRSGLGNKKGLVLGNLVGLVDSDYQGPVLAGAWNRNTTAPENNVEVKYGERIGQIIFVPVVHPRFNQVSEFDTTERGENGIGHSGVK